MEKGKRICSYFSESMNYQDISGPYIGQGLSNHCLLNNVCLQTSSGAVQLRYNQPYLLLL